MPARALRVALIAGALIAVGLVAGAASRDDPDREAARAASVVECGADPIEVSDLNVVQSPPRAGHRSPAPLSQRQALRKYLPAAGVHMPADEFVRYAGSPTLFVNKAGGRIRATAELGTVGASWFVRTITACDRDVS